ncbi:MAG TPA: hypothetical protein VN684_08545 [Terriglobales bacterium]|nr:hypothetical protein [Terriglobales bacterium]
MACHQKSGSCKAGIAFFLVCSVAPLLAQQATPPPQTSTEPSSQTIAPPAAQSVQKPELPDSPGATAAQQQTPGSVPVQQPTGTAAAQQGKISGSALSEPAGVAIAPAKQRRVRSILIKMGFIAGAGIALGTVAALSAASPAKPPGAQ